MYYIYYVFVYITYYMYYMYYIYYIIGNYICINIDKCVCIHYIFNIYCALNIVIVHLS